MAPSGMVVVAPLVETEQDRFIRVEDLPEVVMLGSRRPQAEERLVPLETGGHVGHANDRPDPLHRVLLLRLDGDVEPRAVALLRFRSLRDIPTISTAAVP